MDPLEHVDFLIEDIFNSGGDLVPLQDTEGAIDANGNVYDQTRTEPVRHNFLDMHDLGDREGDRTDLPVKNLTRYGIHEIAGRFAKNFDAGEQYDNSNDCAGKRVNPGVSHPSEENAEACR